MKERKGIDKVYLKKKVSLVRAAQKRVKIIKKNAMNYKEIYHGKTSNIIHRTVGRP